MSENYVAAKHLNNFNTIISQLSAIQINFVDEVKILIILVSLLNSREAMRMSVSNSVRKENFNYADIRYLILNEVIRRKDFGEPFTSSSALNVEVRGKSPTR